MPKCTDARVEFGRVGRRVVEAEFSGGDIVSDGGGLLLKQVDERLGLSRAAALAIGDKRRSASVRHDLRSLLAHRIYGLCLVWSDVCDHNTLRNDLVMQTAVGRAESLGSAPTLSRLETGATAQHAAALHERGSVTIIAPKVDGYVSAVLVQDFSTVRSGDVLVQLDDRNYRERLAQARATLAVQQAALANVTQTSKVREAAIANLDAALVAAQAAKATADAQLERERSDLMRI